MSGHVDVLALIAEVEKRLGEVRTQVHGQHEDETARAREVGRLRGEIGILEDERSRLLSRQLSLESQLAEARASESDAHAEIERVKSEALRDRERMAADARDARAMLSTEMTLEFERRATESARRLAEAERAAEAAAESRTERVRELASEAASTRAMLIAAEARIASLENERDALSTELVARTNERDTLATELGTLSHERDALSTELVARTNERDTLASERTTLATELGTLSHERDTLASERAALASERTSLATELGTLSHERDTLSTELVARTNERDTLASERTTLASELGTLSHERDTLATERDALSGERAALAVERDQITAELAASHAERASIAAELRAQGEELARKSDELEGLAASLQALASGEDAACAERAQREAEIEGLAREIASLREERDTLVDRLSEAEIAVRNAEESLAQAREDAARSAEEAARAAEDAARASGAGMRDATSDAIPSTIDEEEIARAAEARIQQIMAPKVAQLAQAASFLRKRKERLATVRAGLRRKAKAMRVLRQIYAQPRLDAGLAPAPVADSAPGAVSAPQFALTQASASEGNPVVDRQVADERAELARERQELVDLRAIVAASERSLERRAQGTRTATVAALAVAMLGIGSVASWHVAGAIAPDRVRASVELDVSSRTPEAKQEAPVDAKPIADELGRALADEAFVGAVASRIVERGRSREEAAALVAGLAGRASVSAEGSVVRVALAGEGGDATVAALDAVATSAVAEINRRPDRRSDMLRVGIANARQEVGRTVFSKAEDIADPTRLWRAGAILGAFTLLAAAAATAMAWFARRAAHADVG